MNLKKTKPQIIAIVGMPGAGKSEAASFFDKKGNAVLRFGKITDEGVLAAGKELTEENERCYREKLRSQLGMEAYAVKIKPKIDEIKDQNKIIVLDGLYSWEEYIYLKNEYVHLILLCIYARPDIRYQRLIKRNHRRRDLSTARKRDIAELEKLNKGGAIAISDYLIKNEGTKQELKQKLMNFLDNLAEYEPRYR